MRALSVQEIMSRIAVAETESPIAVFRNPDGSFDARFSTPILTRLALDMRPPELVGIYTRHDNKHEILAAMGYTARREADPAKRRAGRKGHDRKKYGFDMPTIGDVA